MAKMDGPLSVVKVFAQTWTSQVRSPLTLVFRYLSVTHMWKLFREKNWQWNMYLYEVGSSIDHGLDIGNRPKMAQLFSPSSLASCSPTTLRFGALQLDFPGVRRVLFADDALNFAKGPNRKRSWDTSFGPFLWKEGFVDQHLGFRTNDSHSERAKRGAMWGWTAWGWDVGVSVQFFWPQKSVAYIYISYMWEVVPCS